MPILSIQDGSFPFLVIEGDTVPLSWTRGLLFIQRMGAGFIRINSRGIQYYLGDELSTWALPSEWTRASCTVTQEGLCQETQAGRMLYFPEQEAALPDDFSLLTTNDYLRKIESGVNGSACSSSDSGRQIVVGDRRYELSLCDLFDSKLDIVYDSVHQHVYWRQETTPFWFYMLISLIGIYLISSISQNIVRLFPQAPDEDKKDDPQPKPNRGHNYIQQGIILLTVLLLEADFWFFTKSWTYLLTQQDYDLSRHLTFYILYGLAYQFLSDDTTHRNCVSVITATLLLLSCRIHHTFDNPYIMVLSILFGIRSLYKFFDVDISLVSPTTTHSNSHAWLVIDWLTFVSVLTNGVSQTSLHTFDDFIKQSTTLLVSTLVAVPLFMYHIKKESS